jgi:hypothetical protein
MAAVIHDIKKADCLDAQLDFERAYVEALAGNYRSQVNVAINLTSSPLRITLINFLQGCAWWMVAINSNSAAMRQGDRQQMAGVRQPVGSGPGCGEGASNRDCRSDPNYPHDKAGGTDRRAGGTRASAGVPGQHCTTSGGHGQTAAASSSGERRVQGRAGPAEGRHDALTRPSRPRHRGNLAVPPVRAE